MRGISVVIPLTHASQEYLDRLQTCFSSLRWQSLRRELFDVVVSFVFPASGEGHPYAQSDRLLELAADMGATIVTLAHEHDDFPPALVRNVGGRWARRECVTFVDVDAFLHPDALRCSYETVTDRPATATTIRTRMTPFESGHLAFTTPDRATFAANALVGTIAPGTGCCTVCRTKDFEAIGGFDERFVGYGPTDIDFSERLKRAGIEVIDLTEGLGIVNLHQHHERGDREGEPDGGSRARNRRLMLEALEAGSLTRNAGGWGGLPW